MLLINQIKKDLKEIGAVNIKLKNNYHYFSGFFQYQGKWFYINSGDDRVQQKNFMIRTAKDDRDYTGGMNNFIRYDPRDLSSIKYDLRNFLENN